MYLVYDTNFPEIPPYRPRLPFDDVKVMTPQMAIEFNSAYCTFYNSLPKSFIKIPMFVPSPYCNLNIKSQNDNLNIKSQNDNLNIKSQNANSNYFIEQIMKHYIEEKAKLNQHPIDLPINDADIQIHINI